MAAAISGGLARTLRDMPFPLRLLCASVCGIDIFVAWSAVPVAQITVFDRAVSMSAWWASGAGPLTLVVAAWMTIAVYLILHRAKIARPLFVCGWVLMSFAVTYISVHFDQPLRDVLVGLATNGIICAGIAVYLWYNRSAVRYFDGTISAESAT